MTDQPMTPERLSEIEAHFERAILFHNTDGMGRELIAEVRRLQKRDRFLVHPPAVELKYLEAAERERDAALARVAELERVQFDGWDQRAVEMMKAADAEKRAERAEAELVDIRMLCGDKLSWAREFPRPHFAGGQAIAAAGAMVDAWDKAEARVADVWDKAQARVAELEAQVSEQIEELTTTQGERDAEKTVNARNRGHSNRWFETCKRRTREWRAEKVRAEKAEARVAELERCHDLARADNAELRDEWLPQLQRRAEKAEAELDYRQRLWVQLSQAISHRTTEHLRERYKGNTPEWINGECDMLTEIFRERDEARARVAELKAERDSWFAKWSEQGDRQARMARAIDHWWDRRDRERERAEKAEAEVDRLRKAVDDIVRRTPAGAAVLRDEFDRLIREARTDG